MSLGGRLVLLAPGTPPSIRNGPTSFLGVMGHSGTALRAGRSEFGLLIVLMGRGIAIAAVVDVVEAGVSSSEEELRAVRSMASASSASAASVPLITRSGFAAAGVSEAGGVGRSPLWLVDKSACSAVATSCVSASFSISSISLPDSNSISSISASRSVTARQLGQRKLGAVGPCRMGRMHL